MQLIIAQFNNIQFRKKVHAKKVEFKLNPLFYNIHILYDNRKTLAYEDDF